MKRITIIKLCMLAVTLAVMTVLYVNQDTVLRVAISRQTIVRPGQHLTVTADTGSTGQYATRADTPYYTIYEYYASIPAGIWSDTEQIRFEIGQVRRDDRIYIESVSVKRPFFNEQIFDAGAIFENMHSVNSAEITISDNLLDIKVTATRAHTPSMDTEGPSFSLPVQLMKTAGVPDNTYIFYLLAAVLVWVTLAYLVPQRVYAMIPARLRGLAGAIKHLSIIDIAIMLTGVASMVFNFYARRITGDSSTMPYLIFTSAFIALVIIKIIGTGRETGIQKMPELQAAENSGTPEWMTYLLLVLLSALVYIPAAFPNPYFANDEHQVISGAQWYLANGNFDFYYRAWPHTWLVAQVIRFFGLSTASTRLLSAVFGIIFIVSAYYVINKITGRKNAAILSAVLILCNPNIISIFTTVRMYAVMLPLTLWLLFFIYMTLHREMVFKQKNIVTEFIDRNFNFHIGYALVTAFLIWLNFLIHNNSLVLLPCAAVYVIITAILSKKRKYIILSIIGIAGITVFALTYYLYVYASVQVPVITRIVRIFYTHGGFGQYNYNYFQTNISIPLGLYPGILLLLSAALSHLRKRKDSNYHYLTFLTVCYAVTVVFFVYFADRYYSYVYMAFIIPVTAALISIGFYELAAKVKASTRMILYLIVITACALQMSSRFENIYIDNPDDTKFERPYMTLANDAKNEGLDSIPLFSVFARTYFTEIVPNGYRAGSMAVESGEVYELDKWVRNLEPDKSIYYFFSEESKFWHTRGTNGEFLNAATDLITTIDASVVRKYHVIRASHITGSSEIKNTGNTVTVTDVYWEGDVAYLQCEMNYIADFSGAVFVAIEVIEQGIAQSAAHRYQVFVPENFQQPDTLGFTLPLRPKTEEYSENITFGISNWAYVYYGMNTSAFAGFSDN